MDGIRRIICNALILSTVLLCGCNKDTSDAISVIEPIQYYDVSEMTLLDSADPVWSELNAFLQDFSAYNCPEFFLEDDGDEIRRYTNERLILSNVEGVIKNSTGDYDVPTELSDWYETQWFALEKPLESQTFKPSAGRYLVACYFPRYASLQPQIDNIFTDGSMYYVIGYEKDAQSIINSLLMKATDIMNGNRLLYNSDQILNFEAKIEVVEKDGKNVYRVQEWQITRSKGSIQQDWIQIGQKRESAQ